MFFSVKKDSRTRGHEVSSQRTVNEWNILSADCVNASSMNMFKKKLINITEGRVSLDDNLVKSVK